MLRRSFLVMLVLALLAGPALGAHSGQAGSGCEHAGMQSSAGGDCGGDGGMASSACAFHCGAAWSVPQAAPAAETLPSPVPVTPRLKSLAGCRAGPPETAPPKA